MLSALEVQFLMSTDSEDVNRKYIVSMDSLS